MRIPQVLPPYHGPLRTAVAVQFLALTFTGLILDGGRTTVHFLLMCLPLWAVFGVVAFRRREPSRIELALIALGPAVPFVSLPVLGLVAIGSAAGWLK